MSLLDIILQALSNLRRQKLRTSLTVTGVALGVATITIMVSFGAGIRKMVAEKFDRAELLTIVHVTPFKMPRTLDDFRKMQAHPPKPVPFNDETIEQLEKELPNAKAIYPDVSAPLTAENDGRVESVTSEGLPVKALGETHRKALLVGDYWKGDDAEDVAVLPSNLLDPLGIGKAQDALGKTLVFSRFDEIFNYHEEPEKNGPDGKPLPRKMIRRADAKTREVTIIGVYDSDAFGISGGQIHVPVELGKSLLKLSGMKGMMIMAKESKYKAIIVKLADRRDAQPARDRIEALGYGTAMAADILPILNFFFAVVEAALALFGGIGLFVACFGIANTMLMAVLERTREIGVLKALGGRHRDVRRVFLFEAASIGLAGGLLGVGAGTFAGFILNLIATSMAGDPSGKTVEIFYVPAWLAIGATGFATFVAGASGLYPAWRAARLDPVEALRRE